MDRQLAMASAWPAANDALSDIANASIYSTPSGQEQQLMSRSTSNGALQHQYRQQNNTRPLRNVNGAIARGHGHDRDSDTDMQYRVTLKMDVSFTDHSHIIGKGGRSIQSVMNDTGCHIHFPDSNRTNTFEKSNQVSIAGSAEGAELACTRIRALLPITVYFDVPASFVLPCAFDTANPIVQAVQRNFGLVVGVKQVRDESSTAYSYGQGAPTGTVRFTARGTRAHVLGLRQGVGILLENLTQNWYTIQNCPVCIDIEVATQHHAFVMGRANGNVRAIQQVTGALIQFPDHTSNSIMAQPAASSLPLKSSTISVTSANFDSVFLAWVELLGYLPLVLLFDLPEAQECDHALITQLMATNKNLSIVIKPKMKKNVKAIMVRVAERDAKLLFDVREQVLNAMPSTSANSTLTPYIGGGGGMLDFNLTELSFGVPSDMSTPTAAPSMTNSFFGSSFYRPHSTASRRSSISDISSAFDALDVNKNETIFGATLPAASDANLSAVWSEQRAGRVWADTYALVAPIASNTPTATVDRSWIFEHMSKTVLANPAPVRTSNEKPTAPRSRVNDVDANLSALVDSVVAQNDGTNEITN